MIYNISGIATNSAYDVSGNHLNRAYDVSGNQVFSGSISLKVMTYNVGGWYTGSGGNVPAAKKDTYYALQTGMITDNDPDILIIQEYLAQFSDDGTSALTMLQGLFPYVHAVTSGTYFGRAVCSKYPITDYVQRAYTQESSRYFDSCTITVNGVPITVVNTHLGLTQANRTPELSQLIGFLNTQTRFICGGDFNTSIMPTETTSSTSYVENVKPLLDEGYHMANFAEEGFLVTSSDKPDGTWDGCLDNIVTSSNISVSGAYVDTTKLTDGLNDKIDHMPLIATVSY